jgi:enoyl-CoA hydratase
VPYETLLFDKDGHVATITLNRPERRNALNVALLRELSQVIDEVAADDEVRVVIITGGREAFSAGADIKDAVAGRGVIGGPRPDRTIPMARGRDVFSKIESLDKITIAAISGYALGGGCELALACDLRIASETAQLGQPEIKLGVIPLGGGTQRLPRLIGPARAKELMFLGDFIDAQEAHRIGLVNRVVPVDSLMDEARKLAAALVEKPPLALRAIKSAVNVALETSLNAGLEYESRVGAIAANSEDRREGMRAFVEKRKPVFKGR